VIEEEPKIKKAFRMRHCSAQVPKKRRRTSQPPGDYQTPRMTTDRDHLRTSSHNNRAP
jgi:hypothetical protein